MADNKAASLLPDTYTSGGAMADGEYTIEAVVTDVFNYGGVAPDTPCMCITYKSEDGDLVDQHYSAGKMNTRIPSEDGKSFVLPSGEPGATIDKKSNVADWVKSIINAGFPVAKIGEDVTVFVGTKVLVVNKAQPMRGIQDEKQGKTIPLIAKILALPGERKAAGGRPSAKPAATTSTKPPARAAASATTTSPSNGASDLTEAAIAAVQEALAEAPNNALTRMKLSTSIMIRLAKAKDPNMAAIKKLASTADFLMENAEAGGWVSDGETVELGAE